MRLDPSVHSTDAIAQYQLAQRRYARRSLAGIVAYLLALAAYGLHQNIVAIVILAAGTVVVMALATRSFREIHAASKRLARERAQKSTAHSPVD
jgi:hypothetical protein